MPNQESRHNKTLHWQSAALLTAALASLLWSIYFSLVTISMPYQIELREGTAQLITQLMLQGKNPFSLDFQPLGMTNYGLGYNLAALPFAAVFGNTLSVHRAVTFIFIILCAGLGYFMVYQKTGEIPRGLVCASFIVIGLIANGGIGAFPSSLGALLFLLSVFIPLARSFDIASLILSALLAIAAFYTKPYFVLAFGVVISYLTFFVSVKKGAVYGAFFGVVFAGLFAAVRKYYPLYFINTILGNTSNALMSNQHMLSQLNELFSFFYPALSLAVIALLGWFWNKDWRALFQSNAGARMNFIDWNRGLIPNFSFNYPFYLFACSMLAFMFILGPHQGSYMNYAYQLIVPAFFIWLLSEIGGGQKMNWGLAFVISFSLFLWQPQVLKPQMLLQKRSKEWAQFYAYLESSKVILNSPVAASEIIALGMTPIDSGQTSYFYQVDPYTGRLFTDISYDELQYDGFRYMLTVDRMIEKQRFDLVILTAEKSSFYHAKLIPQYYALVDEIKLDMPQTGQHWTMLLWRPTVR